MDRSTRFWDRVANRYSRQAISDPVAYQEKLTLTQRYLTEESNVLEVGCGTGSTARIHAPRVKHLLAIDSSTQMIEIARRKAAESEGANLEFRRATLFDLPEEMESFEAVLALNVLHLMDDPRAAIQRVHQLLKPAGLFVSSTACIGDSSGVLRFALPIGGALGLIPRLQYFTRRDLDGWLSDSGFEIVERREPAKKLGSCFLIARKTA